MKFSENQSIFNTLKNINKFLLYLPFIEAERWMKKNLWILKIPKMHLYNFLSLCCWSTLYLFFIILHPIEIWCLKDYSILIKLKSFIKKKKKIISWAQQLIYESENFSFYCTIFLYRKYWVMQLLRLTPTQMRDDLLIYSRF